MPKRTFSPKKQKRIKKHGFMHRMQTQLGRNVLKRRRTKSRKQLAVSKKA